MTIKEIIERKRQTKIKREGERSGKESSGFSFCFWTSINLSHALVFALEMRRRDINGENFLAGVWRDVEKWGFHDCVMSYVGQRFCLSHGESARQVTSRFKLSYFYPYHFFSILLFDISPSPLVSLAKRSI